MVVNTIAEIKIIQVNLHHFIAATSTLVQRAKYQNISIACVQEMHQVRSAPVGIPSPCKLFVTQREALKAGIICFNQDLPIMKVFLAINTVGATLPYRGKNLLIINVYCPPKEELQHTLDELENCLMLPHDTVLITGDFNSKSPIEGEYKFKLLQAKREGWSDTCEEVTTTQPFGVHFDIAKNPERRHFQLSAVQRPDGTLTSTTEEALQELLEFHFPSDPLQDSPANAIIRLQSKDPPLTLDDPPFNSSELAAAVKNIRNKKAPGPDGLFGDIVKEAYKVNKPYLLDLFNACLSKGHFPANWKKAELVLFNKNNKKDTDPAAFRPICLLDALVKILDRLTTQRIFHHLLKHNKISAHQYGFTSGRSAPEVIIQLKEWIVIARSQKKHSAIISLDVKSAFSRVWWPLVLHNLKRMACPRNLFNLVASFVDRRSISFKYGDTVFTREYSIGCPQGSNSGPLFWLLIVNDALEMDFGQDVRILAYADDIYLFVAATGKQNVKKYAEAVLGKLQDWSASAKVQFAH
ncbi:Retrovirus-related Pol polyprotein from type-1 retrotransposable element R1 [Araneus ventricosus]|uniref:Retrovirus-related Pol polyprotein from type-1 retrotransposable element R1 n=1 Tax=Araneus ventricosus TaxID=182803 RepID=A0A4Y2TA69_ARAVE|nr:Retrovirus-related Pol polyprotein from type-1 retrotransposable element R1 [Araneus ventricosus]